MVRRIRARFDGRVIVPEEPLALPLDTPLEIDVQIVSENPLDSWPTDPAERLRRARLAQGIISGPVLPDEALRRENLYDERQ